MKIRLTNPNAALEASAFTSVESALGHNFPDSYCDFMLRKNGGMPPDEHCIFDDASRDISIYVQYFFPLEELSLDGICPMPLDRNFLPIALEGGGSYILLDLPTGEIHLWDYETEQILKLGESIDGFLCACSE